MRIELLGHAPTQDAMWAYLKDMGWAAEDKEYGWNTTEGVQVSQIGPIVTDTKNIAGWHFNLRFYGDLAQRMVADKDQTEVKDGKAVLKEFWSRTNFQAEVEEKTKRTQTLKTRGDLPEGYEDSTHKVRIFPADKINKRKNVWA